MYLLFSGWPKDWFGFASVIFDLRLGWLRSAAARCGALPSRLFIKLIYISKGLPNRYNLMSYMYVPRGGAAKHLVVVKQFGGGGAERRGSLQRSEPTKILLTASLTGDLSKTASTSWLYMVPGISHRRTQHFHLHVCVCVYMYTSIGDFSCTNVNPPHT